MVVHYYESYIIESHIISEVYIFSDSGNFNNNVFFLLNLHSTVVHTHNKHYKLRVFLPNKLRVLFLTYANSMLSVLMV
jgi:hypothetical protein